ncbi:NAD(P)-binding protein [Rhodotorula sp. JG-1b]|nr:NAD(P)-binding protein [Rhodotorula sp. JG-1b]
MSSSPLVYFVTGANRGIGFALVEQLATRDNVLIFAGARDPSKADRLNQLAQEQQGKIVVVKLDATSEEDAKKAAETVKEKVSKVDVLIANAGIGNGTGAAHELDLAEMHSVIDVNVGGPLRIYKALYPLLLASSAPRVIGVSSTLGSIAFNLDADQIGPYKAGSYSVSKTALNMLFARIHTENHKDHNMTAFVVCPGHTQTDMGNAGAQNFGLEKAPVKLADSIKGLLELIDDETGQYAGRFMSYDGAERQW